MSKILSREKAQCVPKLTLLIPFKQSNGPSVDLREFLPGICVSFLNDISETRGEKKSFDFVLILLFSLLFFCFDLTKS